MKLKTANLQHEKIILGSWFADYESEIFYNIIQECILVPKIITDSIKAQLSVS